jgi:hypothetical protein
VLGRKALGRAGRLVAASAVLAGALALCAAILPIGERGLVAGGARLALHVGVGAGAYLLALRALRSPELDALLALVRRG